MGFKEKLENAKPTDWLTVGLSAEEIKTIARLATILTDIEKCRDEANLYEKDFWDIFDAVMCNIGVKHEADRN